MSSQIEDNLLICPKCDCDLILLTNKIMQSRNGLIGQPPQLIQLPAGFMCVKCSHLWDGDNIKLKKSVISKS
jgi:hypothetical protein